MGKTSARTASNPSTQQDRVRTPQTLLNTETLDWRATEALLALDKSFIGTESYMGLAYFWAWEFRHALREASYAVRRRVHTALLREGLEPAGLSGRHAEIIERATRTNSYSPIVKWIEQMGGDPTHAAWWKLADDALTVTRWSSKAA